MTNPKILLDVQRSPSAPQQKRAAALGVPEGSPLMVERHERSFSLKYTPGGKNTPPAVRVTVNVDETNESGSGGAYRESSRDHLETRPAIILRRETRADRFGKRIGLNREIATGDDEFDAAVYIETASPEEDVKRALADDRLRKAVRDLLDARVAKVELDPTGLSAVRSLGSLGYGLESDYLVDQTLDLLAKAAAALPLFKVGRAARPRKPIVEAVALLAACVTIPFLMMFGGRAPLGTGALVIGVGSGLGLWVLGVLAAVRFLGGRSDSLRRVALLSLAGLMGLPLGTYTTVCWVNRAFDTSPGVDHVTTITRTWSSSGKNRTYYHLDVGSWREGEQTVSLSVSPAFANKANKGLGIVVTTHAGRLGWEWVETFYLTR